MLCCYFFFFEPAFLADAFFAFEAAGFFAELFFAALAMYRSCTPRLSSKVTRA
jgi:hypothetical protein